MGHIPICDFPMGVPPPVKMIKPLAWLYLVILWVIERKVLRCKLLFVYGQRFVIIPMGIPCIHCMADLLTSQRRLKAIASVIILTITLKLYVKLDWAEIGHWVIIVPPSMYWVPRWCIPCQWMDVPSLFPSRFHTFTSISSFSHTCCKNVKSDGKIHQDSELQLMVSLSIRKLSQTDTSALCRWCDVIIWITLGISQVKIWDKICDKRQTNRVYRVSQKEGHRNFELSGPKAYLCMTQSFKWIHCLISLIEENPWDHIFYLVKST